MYGFLPAVAGALIGLFANSVSGQLLGDPAERTGAGAALNALEKNGDLPYGPNEYVRGLWKLSHAGGSHPGLSDEEDAQHRIYAISAIVAWLVRKYT